MKIGDILLAAGAAAAVIAGISYLAKPRESSKPSTDLPDNDLPDERGRGDRESTVPARAILNDPISSEAYIHHTRDLFGTGHGPEKLLAIDHASHLDPNDPTSHIVSGILSHGLRDREDAIDSFDEAIALDPKATYAYVGRGYILYTLARYEEAYASLACARALGCNDPKMHHYIGLTLEFLARQHDSLSTVLRSLAIKSFQCTLDIDEHHFDAQCALKHVSGLLA